MNDNHARNKTELATRLGYTRGTIYSYMRLPGFPVPDRRGRWNISSCRKFILKQANKLDAPSERDRLELELLRKRIHRVDLEIADLDNSRAEEIADNIYGQCKQIIDTLNGTLQAMPQQLSGIFSQLDGAMPIYQRFKSEMDQRFADAYSALLKVRQASRRRSNVVPFNSAKLNGNGRAMALNGNGAR
jgi:hypothetical protein